MPWPEQSNIRSQWLHGWASEHLYFFKRHLSHARTARGLRRRLTVGADASFDDRASISIAGWGEVDLRRLSDVKTLFRWNRWKVMGGQRDWLVG